MDFFFCLQGIWCFHETLSMATSTNHVADTTTTQEPSAFLGLGKTVGNHTVWIVLLYVFFLHL
jgi:hypothetical protein